MVNPNVCAECNGKGSYDVFNAYDPAAKEEVICEHCDGNGVPNSTPVRAHTPNEDGRWLN